MILVVLGIILLMAIIIIASMIWLTKDYDQEEKDEAWKNFMDGFNGGMK